MQRFSRWVKKQIANKFMFIATSAKRPKDNGLNKLVSKVLLPSPTELANGLRSRKCLSYYELRLAPHIDSSAPLLIGDLLFKSID